MICDRDRMSKARRIAAALVLAAVPVLGHPGIHEQEATADAAIAADPSDFNALLMRGRLHFEQKEWDRALSLYHRAQGLGAPQERVAYLEGQVFLAAGWPRTALRSFDSALAIVPAYPEARIGRARALVALGEPDKAEDDYAAAFAALERASPSLVLERHRALIAAGRSEDALALLDRQIAVLGLAPPLQMAAVDLEIAAGRTDAALERVDALLAESSGHPLWAARKARILDEAGRAKEAEVAYRQALEFVQSRNARRGSKRLQALERELVARLTEISAEAQLQGGQP